MKIRSNETRDVVKFEVPKGSDPEFLGFQVQYEPLPMEYNDPESGETKIKHVNVPFVELPKEGPRLKTVRCYEHQYAVRLSGGFYDVMPSLDGWSEVKAE